MQLWQSGLCKQRRENKWLLKGRFGKDNVRLIDRGPSLKLMILVAELLVEICFSDFFNALGHSRLMGVHGKISVSHNEQRVLFVLQFFKFGRFNH